MPTGTTVTGRFFGADPVWDNQNIFVVASATPTCFAYKPSLAITAPGNTDEVNYSFADSDSI